jgi:hypothetical protein
MARCEACGGSIRERLGGTGQADTLIDITKFEFDTDVGPRTGRWTFFCSYECAIRGLEDDLLNESGDSMFYADRRGDGPQNYPDPETEPLVRRAKELLETAQEGANDIDLELDLDDAIRRIDDALDTLADEPDPDDRVYHATGEALDTIYAGEEREDAVIDAAVEYNIVDRLGLVNAEVVDTLDERTRGGA